VVQTLAGTVSTFQVGIKVALIAAVDGKNSNTVAGTMITPESELMVAINDGAMLTAHEAEMITGETQVSGT
jgi:hypothetical protein